MSDNINKDIVLFRSEPNRIAFVFIIVCIIGIIYHAFTDHEITRVIGDNILNRILGIFGIIILINNQRLWIKLTDTSMIVHNSKKMLGFEMQTIEIPYQDIEIVRIPLTGETNVFFKRININNVINIKYKGNPQAISVFSIDDINGFITELENRKINVNTDMDNDEFQQYIKTLNTQTHDVKKEKKETFLKDISNSDNLIKFNCGLGLLPVWITVSAFVVFTVVFGLSKGGLLSFKSSSIIFVLLICFIVIFIYAIIIHKRLVSNIIITPNNIIINKCIDIIHLKRYEIYPSDIEYVNIDTNGINYIALFKIKKREEKIVIKHIKEGDKLKNSVNVLGIVTSGQDRGIQNHKISYDKGPVDKYLSSIKMEFNTDGNKYFCNSSFYVKSRFSGIITLVLLGLPISAMYFMYSNINMSRILISLSFILLFYIIILSVIGHGKSFVELGEDSIKIKRLNGLIPKMKETIIAYNDIDKVIIEKQRRHKGYNVYLYSLIDNCIFFNVDDGVKLKNELKRRGIDVKINE